MADNKVIRFLKDHVNGIKKGDIGEIAYAKANYLVRVGVAEYIDGIEPKKAVTKRKTSKKKTAKGAPCKTC